MKRMPLGLLAWLVAVVAWGTWAPFTLRPAGDPPVLQLAPQWNGETLAHVAMLVPAAVVFTVLTLGRERRWPRLSAALLVTALALLLEAGQWWIEVRSVSPFDVLAGVLGGIPAVWITAQRLQRGSDPRRLLLGVGLIVVAAVLVVFTHALVRQVQGQVLAGFNPEYPIVAGDEMGGGRAYVGRVSEARVCGGAPEREVCAASGADLASRLELARHAEQDQRLRLSATIVSESDAQSGPTRIVTFSDGPYLRNVTLAQEQQTLVLRVRTWRAGANGTGLAFALRDAVPAGIPCHVAAEFDRGAVELSSSCGAVARRDRFDPPLENSLRLLASNPQGVPIPMRGRGLNVGAVVLFTGLGLAAAWVLRPPAACLPWLGAAVAIAYLRLLDAALYGALAPGLSLYALAGVSAALSAVVGSERQAPHRVIRDALGDGLPSPEAG